MNRYFNGIPVGGVCTGTIAYFGLSAKSLLDKGIITKRDVRSTEDARYAEHYVFMGFPVDEEQFENPPQ